MSLSTKAREQLGWLVDDDAFIPVAEQAIENIISGKKQDDTRNKNRRKSLKSIERLHKALVNLTDEARQYLDARADVLPDGKTLPGSKACDVLLLATMDKHQKLLPKQNASKALLLLKVHIRFFIRNGWLESQTSKTAPLCEVVQILIDEAGITHNAHKAVRAAVAELEKFH